MSVWELLSDTYFYLWTCFLVYYFERFCVLLYTQFYCFETSVLPVWSQLFFSFFFAFAFNIRTSEMGLELALCIVASERPFPHGTAGSCDFFFTQWCPFDFFLLHSSSCKNCTDKIKVDELVWVYFLKFILRGKTLWASLMGSIEVFQKIKQIWSFKFRFCGPFWAKLFKHLFLWREKPGVKWVYWIQIFCTPFFTS